MDLEAYVIHQNEQVENYIKKHYGYVPRMRGVRFMKIEEPSNEHEEQMQIFDSYCGKDVIYIHTRCGGSEYDDDSNYVYFGAKEWENNNPLFIEGVTDEFDCTYRDHYFNAVKDDDYYKIIKGIMDAKIYS